MERLPLVTLITPAYNYADLLPETIDSILAQDYTNIEYIVLNDGSIDNTEEVLASYTDPRLRWETQDNMGEPHTVNKGFQMAKGDYFIVVNADDPVLPHLVSKAVEFMESHPEVLVAYPRWLEIDPNGETIRECPTYEYDFANMVKWHHCMPGPGTIIRRKAIELTGGRDTSFRWLSDIHLWLRVALHGPLARIPHVLASQRIHPRARTQADKGVALAKEHVRVMEEFYDRPDLPRNVLKVKREALSTVHYISGYMCAVTRKRKWARHFFVRSFLYAPFAPRRYANGLHRSWRISLVNILVPGWVRPLRLHLKRFFSPTSSLSRSL